MSVPGPDDRGDSVRASASDAAGCGTAGSGRRSEQWPAQASS